MNKTSVAAALGGLLLVSTIVPSTAFAQALPLGAEITGHSVRVQTSSGAVNTVYFDPGGSARIVSAGGTEVPGRWTVENGMLCLEAAGGRECWPYQAPFQSGVPVQLTSTCGTSTWTAVSTEPPPTVERGGERGR